MNNGEMTPDSVKYGKHCGDFVCLKDGTVTGEYRYCEYSTACRQVDFIGGKAIPMEAHYLPIVDVVSGELIANELFCTGKHDLRPLYERMDDDKVV